MYRGFQEPRNHRLARGVESLGAAALLALAYGAEDELEPKVATSSAAFFVAPATSAAIFVAAASSTAFFATATSSMAFFTIAVSSAAFFTASTSSTTFFTMAASAASFSVVVLLAAVVSHAAEMPPDPVGAIARTATDELGCGVVAASGGSSATNPPMPATLIRLCSRTSSSDDTSLSLWRTRTTYPLSLLGAGVETAPPWPPATPILGIHTPRELSPLWTGAMPTSSIEGITTSSNMLAA
jgi:hypothetical protein